MKDMGLDDGWKQFTSGTKLEGKWGYIPERDKIELIDGWRLQKNGVKCRGKYKYYPEKKGMDLEDGWVEYSSGTKYEGKWGCLTTSEKSKLTVKFNNKRPICVHLKYATL